MPPDGHTRFHLYSRRHVASIADHDATERMDLARALLSMTATYDRHFGFSTPHVMAMHQAPTDGRKRPRPICI
jgi:UDPglucose--hexose-1-phosphate uridylyltransferase